MPHHIGAKAEECASLVRKHLENRVGFLPICVYKKNGKMVCTSAYVWVQDLLTKAQKESEGE